MSHFSILGAEHIEPALALGKNLLLKSDFDGGLGVSDVGFMTKEVKEWVAPWRKESLEFYSKLGWSFFVEHSGVPQETPPRCFGFTLAQMLTFFRSQTQVLWVEFLAIDSTEKKDWVSLVDMCLRYGKDKHIQSVCFSISTQDLLPASHSVLFMKVLEECNVKERNEHFVEVGVGKEVK